MKKIKVTLSSAEIDLLDVLVQAECLRTDNVHLSSLQDKIYACKILTKH